jgi:pyridoxal phosphate-dependent aminotransferase EpsN
MELVIDSTVETASTERSPSSPRIYLSSPHMGGDELALVTEAFQTNWIAPLGPHVDAFEQEFAALVGVKHAAALSSGTAALHLALRMLNVQPGDEVICSSLTFSASANPIVYEGAEPVFVDCDPASWNMDPELLAEEIENCARHGRLPKAVIVVDLYGQAADYERILDVCAKYDVPVVEDAAEALGATCRGRMAGVFGKLGVYSFNGNKIITTSGGGMLVSDDGRLIDKARFLATQARDPAPHYQHSQIGFNYRMSNVLAAIGRGQIRVLEDRVAARRRNFEMYHAALSELPGLEFMPEADYGRCNRWLTCLTINPERFGASREDIRLALEAKNIESRPVWKPMHLQPVFSKHRYRGRGVSDQIFEQGLCLPSGSNLSEEDIACVIETISQVFKSSNTIRRLSNHSSNHG